MIFNSTFGGVQLPELTAPGTAEDLLAGKQLIDANGNVLTGTMEAVAQATPSISVSSTGLITASATQSAGYVAAGTKNATKQLTKQAAQTITPGTTNKTIPSGRYLTGTQTIKGDANLLAANIKSGVSIFGVAGAYEGAALLSTYVTGYDVTVSGSQVTLDIYFNTPWSTLQPWLDVGSVFPDMVGIVWGKGQISVGNPAVLFGLSAHSSSDRITLAYYSSSTLRSISFLYSSIKKAGVSPNADTQSYIELQKTDSTNASYFKTCESGNLFSSDVVFFN